jgi:hypothetical protein
LILETMRRLGGALVLASVATLLACSETGPDAGDPSSVLWVDVSPPEVVLLPGGTQQLTAKAYGSGETILPGRIATWASSNGSVATVNANGLVTAVSEGFATVTGQIAGKSGTASVNVLSEGLTGQVIDVITGLSYQTITGWEGTAQIGEIECNPVAFNNYQAALIDRLANELGINRVRLELVSSTENPTDWFAQFKAGQITRQEWRQHVYQIINDNSDAQSVNASGFKFSLLDHTVDKVVQPLRQALLARGEQLYVNLNYVDFGNSTFEHASQAQEYAELMLATFQHLKSKYGWVPDAVEVILEPDNTGPWRPQSIGAAMVAAGDRLKAAGFNPAFIAPSNLSMSTALQYFDALIAIPRVGEYLTDLAYHRYSGVSDATLSAIGARSNQLGIRTSMLEHIGSGHENLHADLTTGRNSAWQKYTLAYCSDNSGSYYKIDQTNPASPTLSLRTEARYLRQYFRWVRRGAVRVGALTGDARFAPVAFRNANGKFVVIVKAAAGGDVQIRHLPAGTYGINYTTGAAFDVDRPDVTIAAGQSVTASIPASGVVTIYQR